MGFRISISIPHPVTARVPAQHASRFDFSGVDLETTDRVSDIHAQGLVLSATAINLHNNKEAQSACKRTTPVCTPRPEAHPQG